MNSHAGWQCRRRWPSASVARGSSRALPGEARVQWPVGTGPLALPSTALTRPLGDRAPHSHVSAPPAASACLFSFVFLPSYGSQRRSRRNLLRPLPISESAPHGAQGAAAPRTHGVTSANRNHRVFPRLHDSHTNAVSYVGFPWRLAPRSTHTLLLCRGL